MKKSFSDDAWNDIVYWSTHDTKVFKKVLKILEDIERNGYVGIGKPERLSGCLSKYWSRRIDEKNRIVYKIENDTVFVIQCGSHYRDK